MKLSIALATVVTLASSTNALDDGTTPVAKEPLPVLRALAASSPRVSTYVLQFRIDALLASATPSPLRALPLPSTPPFCRSSKP